MPGRWDTSSKRLVNIRPEDFIRWLIPEAQFIGPVEARSLNLNNQEIEADDLQEPRQKALVFQGRDEWLCLVGDVVWGR